MMNPWHDVRIGEDAPEVVNGIIEIPKNTRAKYELDKESEPESEESEAEEKNIVPTRPLPPIQMPDNFENPEDKIPTTEIKQPGKSNESNELKQTPKDRVLFSDAVEKSLKNKNDDEEDLGTGSESESELEYDDDSE